MSYPIFYDTEFLEDGRTIGLISIGMVTPTGRSYYAINLDAPWARIAEHPWLMANVVPSLPGEVRERAQLIEVIHDRAFRVPSTDPQTPATWLLPEFGHPAMKHKSRIADEVRDFILAEPDPELWAWYGAYDHVTLCQLWGRMVALPDGIPMWTNDLKQEAVRQGNPVLPEQPSGEHNALEDARWNMVRARALGIIA